LLARERKRGIIKSGIRGIATVRFGGGTADATKKEGRTGRKKGGKGVQRGAFQDQGGKKKEKATTWDSPRAGGTQRTSRDKHYHVPSRTRCEWKKGEERAIGRGNKDWGMDLASGSPEEKGSGVVAYLSHNQRERA